MALNCDWLEECFFKCAVKRFQVGWTIATDHLLVEDWVLVSRADVFFGNCDLFLAELCAF
jgi:hypothetical protein